MRARTTRLWKEWDGIRHKARSARVAAAVGGFLPPHTASIVTGYAQLRCLCEKTSESAWAVYIFPPDDSPYRLGVVKLILRFPPKYPAAPPRAFLGTSLYHPFLDEVIRKYVARTRTARPLGWQRIVTCTLPNDRGYGNRCYRMFLRRLHQSRCLLSQMHALILHLCITCPGGATQSSGARTGRRRG